ncbi:protein-L-isoaspartate O-methyltransferase [Kibdelosporangium banguiense]|uniref:Protein-L-isoaspartate O-methyltransferase n=1 Tax=Kibdelosporangium banguiense TaxID=1365924 RepID=A0ABS4TZ75_9PSEU|nr:hypothetical protein [Kibdelosporangium banguiense]MBP2329716.1 protein-L-isoaspartate O-methyltransferase [Kibdelosporangium banguiense]
MGAEHRSITTPLRPVYAGFFPRFNPEELVCRVSRLPVHLATQLNPFNLTTYGQLYGWGWFDWYVRQSASVRRILLAEVLETVGVKPRFLEVFRRIDRHAFFSAQFRTLAYLNWSIPVGAGTCVSSPGIIALMCANLPDEIGGLGSEVGLGTGYHAQILLGIYPELSIVGYESSAFAVKIARQAVAASGCARLTIVNQSFMESVRFDHALAFAYHTAASALTPLGNIVNVLREGAMYVAPRALTVEEFSASPQDGWLHEQFPSYSDYLGSGTSVASVLATYQVKQGRLESVDALYGVAFVGWRDRVVDGSSPMSNQGLARLMKAYTARERSGGD